MLLTPAAWPQSWTHVASACVPDESSTGLYQFTNGSVALSPAAPASTMIKLRCNVASPIDTTFPGSPAWTTLEVAYTDPDAGGVNTVVNVQLVRVGKATGAISVVATLVSSAFGPVIGSVPVPPGSFDYTANEYFVAINLTRVGGATTPTVWYVGLH